MREIKTKKELLSLLKTMPIKNKENRNEIVCALIGHSKICSSFWGYRNCGRCGVQLGDSLGSIDFGNEQSVIIGHNCEKCQENYKACTWRDKMYVVNPLKSDD